MSLFKRTNTNNPCLICQRPDWCAFGDRAMKCMRVESAHPAHDGGWYHFYSDAKPDCIPPSTPQRAQPTLDAVKVWDAMRSIESHIQRQWWAQELGVSIESLDCLNMVHSYQYNAAVFPMYSGELMCGLRVRNKSGFKWAISGSRQGVFVSTLKIDRTQPVYLPEGPTSTAALLTMGLQTIGRPTCNSGNDILRDILTNLGVRKVVIVADNDDMKRLGPRDGRPGIEGAQKLQREIGIKSCIYIPPSPCKDVRDMLKKGGNRAMIESEVSHKTWQ